MPAKLAATLAAALLLGCAAHAELRPSPEPRSRPPEKISPRPVQPTPRALFSTEGATVYSPWVKYCGTDKTNPQANPVCLTVREARLETGQFVAGVALIEQSGGQQKLLRFALPLGIRLIPGARVFIDDETVR